MLAFNSLVIVGALTAAGLVWTANDTLSATRRVVIHDAAGADPTGLAGSSVDDITGQPTTTIDLSGSVKAENYLLVGSDSRACIDPSSPYAGAFLTEGNDIGDRSDTIMLLRVDPNESQAAILSFPRDLWVKIGTSNRKSRINSAFDKGDPSRLVQTIELQLRHPGRPLHRGRLLRVQVPGRRPRRGQDPLRLPDPRQVHRPRHPGPRLLLDERRRRARLRPLPSLPVRGERPLEGGRLERPGPHPAPAGLHQADAAQGRRPRATRPDVAKKLIDTALKNVRVDETLTVNDLLKVASRLRKFDPSEVKTYRMDGKGTNVGGASVIVPTLSDPATQNVLKVFRGQATVADVPSSDTAAPGDTSGATDTSAPATSSSTPTSGAGGAVVIEDNGVGIFPPDDPTCR